MQGKLAFLFILVTLSGPLFSQNKNWQPGYVLSIEGDTLKGLLDYQDWKRNPKSISFKSKVGEEKRYAADQIDQFYVKTANELYFGRIVRTDQSSLRSSDVINLLNQNIYKTDTVFLKVLVKGEKNLFQFDDGKRVHFLIGENGNIRELEIKKQRVSQNSGYAVLTINMYREQLRSVMSDCTPKNVDINRLMYGTKSFIKVFLAYHECKSSHVEYINQSNDAFKFVFGITGGAQSTNVKVSSSEGFPTLVSDDYSTSYGPIAGLTCDIIIPKSRGAWSIANSLIYSNYSTSEVTVLPSGLNTYTSDININFSHVKLTNLFRFKFVSNHKFSPFINLGISNSFALKSEFYSIRETSGFLNMTERIDYDTRNHEQGLIVGGGVVFGNWTTEIQYESTNGFSVFSGLGTKVIYTRFLIGYRLSKG